jgi:hypothetical protein
VNRIPNQGHGQGETQDPDGFLSHDSKVANHVLQVDFNSTITEPAYQEKRQLPFLTVAAF